MIRQRTVPGELILKLTDEGAGRLKERLPRRRFFEIKRAQRTGIDAVDKLLKQAGTSKIRRICGGARSILGSTYLAVRFDPNYSPRELAARLRQLRKYVAAAQPNCLRIGEALPAGVAPLPGHLQMIGWNPQLALNGTVAFPLVAILDSGIFRQPFHPQMQPAIDSELDVADVGGFLPSGFRWQTADPTGHDREPDDEVGHGTRMASVLAARVRNGAAVVGIAPRAPLMIVRVLARVIHSGTGEINAFGTAIDIAEGIQAAVNAGARVINMSFGFPRSNALEAEAVKQAVQRGCFVVCAVGNEGPNVSAFFPSAYRGAFAVGAVDQTENRWPGSQVGQHLAVVAPGVGIPAIDLSGSASSSTGTSPAAAIVSGIAALLLGARPNLTPIQLGRLLTSTAIRSGAANGFTGFGIVSLTNALSRINGV